MIRALYGGSFDPIHAGHVALVETMLDRGLADVVHVVCARRSPFKPDGTATDPATRLHLVHLALDGHPGVEIDGRELARPEPSYTVTTLAELVAEHPGDRWRLVIGGDNVDDFVRWHEPERLLALAEPLVVARGAVTLVAPLLERALVLADFAHPASSTRIRHDLTAGRRPGPDLLPAVVADHIEAHGLYGWPQRKDPQ